MNACPHGYAPTELTIAIGVMSGKGGVCRCCGRDQWTWALEDGLCSGCVPAPPPIEVPKEERQ